MIIFFDTVAATDGFVRDKTALFPSTAFVIDVFGGTHLKVQYLHWWQLLLGVMTCHQCCLN
jgi:hypothetical protein